MMRPVRFTENETGIEVLIKTPFAWGDSEKTSWITYPSGREFSIPDRLVSRHFTVVLPQEVFIEAFGAVDERPTKLQRALEEGQETNQLSAVSLQ
jgi:hypothetical protein